ncbi:pseudomurein-binding repeat-containing protein [Methanobrevibacter cuticularis]|uniref:pseudomurein-binding repeat-containing protein n=1 Tax=Methanobrevibacter cuticularis TaxID=47311 RepID=UPI0012EE5471|nr:transglutaminase domain-containing protein [Methanobrevibacter cuticularis]
MLFVFFIGVSTSCAADANTSKSVEKPSKLTQSQILGASKTIKSHVIKNKKLPNSVTIGGYKYSMEEYMYFSSVTINYKYNNKKSDVTVKYAVKSPTTPTGTKISGKLTKKQYTTYATNAYKYIKNNNRVPNFVNTKIGKMQFQTFIYSNSKILAWSQNNKGKLPSSLAMNIAKTNSINKNIPNFPGNTISSNTTPSQKTLTLNQVLDASKRVKDYSEKNSVLPSSVTISGNNYKMNDFLYLMSKAIIYKNSGKTSSIPVLSVKEPVSPSGNNKLGKIQKAEYVSLANSVISSIDSNKQAPNYIKTNLGNLQYQSTVYVFSRIASYIYTNKAMPSYVEVNVTSSSKINGGGSTDSTNTPTSTLLGSDSRGTVELLGAYGNTKSSKKIAYIIGIHPLENAVHTALFNSLVSKSSSLNYCYYVYRITVKQDANDYSKGRMNGQTLARDFILPHIKKNSYGLVVDIHANQGTVGGNYEKTNFIFAPKNNGASKTIAENIINKIGGLCYYYPASQTSPPYLTGPLVDAGINTIIYETYMYESNETTYNLIKQLIDVVDNYNFSSGSGGSGNTSGATVSLAQITDAAKRVENYVLANGVLPNYVEIEGKTYNMPDFLYLLSAAIVNINKGSTGSIKSISVKAASSPVGDSMAGNLNKADFVDVATRVYNYVLNNGQAPNYATSPLGRIQFQYLVYEFSKILEFVNSNNRLPNYVTLNIKTSNELSGGNSGSSTPTGELTQYLKGTKNCQVNDVSIQALAKKLTQGLSSDLDKATAIFDYVRDKITYKYYTNSWDNTGAKGVIAKGWGNCVDQTHLLIALLRATGIPARYVNGKATFNSGTIGHTWAEVYIAGKWITADTTHSNNKLGIVTNWKNPTIYGKYAEITF